MREKSREISSTLEEMEILLKANDEYFLSIFKDKKWEHYYQATHQFISGGVNIIQEKENDYEHGLAQDCYILYKLLLGLNTKDSLRIKKLCEKIHFHFMGYRVQDVDKAPDMIKNFTGIDGDSLLKEAIASIGKPRSRSGVKKELQPKLIENLVYALFIAVLVWFFLDKEYCILYFRDHGHYPLLSENYTFSVSVIMTTLLGLLGLEGYYQVLSKFGVRVRYYFLLCKWRIRWKLFEIPSKIKYYLDIFFQDKKMYFTLFIIVWYLLISLLPNVR